ncbi:hypothetical protein BST61_g601 [Cercospora zeina]
MGASKGTGKKKQAAAASSDDDDSDDDDSDDDDSDVDSEEEQQDPDDEYRRAATRQFKALKTPRRSLRKVQINRLLPLLEIMRPPASDRIQYTAARSRQTHNKRPEAYFLSKEEARTLLRGPKDVRAPVFVSGGAQDVHEPPSRPIEHALTEWFLDAMEEVVFDDTEGTNRNVTIEQLREHFITPSEKKDNGYPWNLPDITNPMAPRCIPSFCQSLNCHLLRDIYRIVLDVEEKNICQDNCPERKPHGQCCDHTPHEITPSELADLSSCARQHEGTLMISDPGSITGPHWDRWCFGTHLSCYEGEWGLSWLSHPTLEQRMIWTDPGKSDNKPEGSWLYKVFREGDAVYMPPGTVHVVFRLPEGKQTLGAAGHVLRRSTDWKNWLKMLIHDKATTLVREGEEAGKDFLAIFGPLVKTLAFLLDQVETEDEIERYGGKKRVKSARKLLKTLERQVAEVVETVKTRAANSS